MRITLINPTPAEVFGGNRVTAERWAGILTGLGHTVRTERTLSDSSCDLLVALHACKSAAAVEAFSVARPEGPIVVALTGTDLYGDLRGSAQMMRVLESATRIVALQPAALDELSEPLRDRVRVIYQSVLPPSRPAEVRPDVFEVCVIGNLREVKDPFRAAEAAELLPEDSRVRVVHVGAALDEEMRRRAEEETRGNDRYEWVGPLSRNEAMDRLAGSRLMALTSTMEGGANVVSESIVCGVPIVASRISGSVGLLGDDYPGFFAVGDTQALAELLRRAETDAAFYETLSTHVARLAPQFHPDAEALAWRALLDEL